jgi:hypothetical protein
MIDACDLMMVMIFGGIALCGVLFRAQYRDWRQQTKAEREKRIRVRQLFEYHWALRTHAPIAPNSLGDKGAGRGFIWPTGS